MDSQQFRQQGAQPDQQIDSPEGSSSNPPTEFPGSQSAETNTAASDSYGSDSMNQPSASQGQFGQGDTQAPGQASSQAPDQVLGQAPEQFSNQPSYQSQSPSEPQSQSPGRAPVFGQPQSVGQPPAYGQPQPQFQSQPQSSGQTPVYGQPPQPSAGPHGFNQPSVGGGKSGKSIKLAGIVAAAVILIGGGGAAAYFGVVAPNKPENILKSAIKNTLKEESTTTKFQVEFKGDDSVAGKIEGSVRANLNTKNFGVDAKGTVMGMSLSGEALYVDSNAYVKIGDLSEISDLLDAYSAGGSTSVTDMTRAISNKWYEIDSTLLDTANATCALDSDFRLQDSDYDLIEKAYKNNQFVVIKDSSSDEVDGKGATKFNLVLDPKKAEPFANDLKDLSVIKKANECNPGGSSSSDNSVDQEIKSQAEELKPMSLSVWVDKDTKRFSRVAIDSKDEEVTVKVDMRLDYAPVIIEKPADARPIMTLMTDLAPLLGELGSKEGAFLGIKDIISE